MHPMVVLGKGVICNTGAIIEHECIIGEYAHIAPGAVLTGNVQIGAHTFVGANSVCRRALSSDRIVPLEQAQWWLKMYRTIQIVAGNPARVLTTKK